MSGVKPEACQSKNKISAINHSPMKRSNTGKRLKQRERRWTTGLEKGQLKLPSIEHPLVGDDMSPVLIQTACNGDPGTLSSWSSTLSDLDGNDSSAAVHNLRTPTPTSGSFSQPDVPHELQQMGKHFFGDHINSHQYQLSYEMAVDSSPLSPSTYVPSSQEVTYCTHIIQEIISTEKRYVKDLTDIIEGYYFPMVAKVGILPITVQDITDLFCNIQEILGIHKILLEDLEKSNGDFKTIGQSFITRAEDFKSYTEYCNNYPKSVETFSKLVSDRGIPWFMKMCQQKLYHVLPLGAYLLKPIQRIMKYFLLLENLYQHMKPTNVGYKDILTAKTVMTQVADHINEMKRKYDDTVRVQELQSLLHGWEGADLVKYGEIALENTLRVAYSKTGNTKLPTSALKSTKEMYVFLFRKLLLITKKKDEGYQYKHHTEMKDMQLTEHLKENNLWFQIRQISTKATLTFQARSPDIKNEWSDQIKALLMESIPHLPDKAKLLILQGFPTDIRKVPGSPKTALETRTLPRDLHGASPTKQYLVHTKGSPTKQNKAWSSRHKAPVKSAKSLMEASLTGYIIGSSSSTSQKVDKSAEDAKKNRRLRFDSLPNSIPASTWKRSDSDPNLPEEDTRSLSRESTKDKVSIDNSSPTADTTVENDSRSSSGSPTINRSQLAVIGVRNSISSPDLKSSAALDEDKYLEIETHEAELHFNNEDSVSSQADQNSEISLNNSHTKLESDSTDDYSSRPMTPLSPAEDTEVTFHINEDEEPSLFPMHMRSKSAPLNMQEPTLETIQSSENTPRGSITRDEISPSFSISDETPLMIVQSVTSTKQDNIIEIRPSLEMSGEHKGPYDRSSLPNSDQLCSFVEEPVSPSLPNSNSRMEMMFEELMSNAVTQKLSPGLLSQEAPVLSFEKQIHEESLGQPVEFHERLCSMSPASIPEITVDFVQHKDNCAEVEPSHHVFVSSEDGSYPNPSTPMRYSRQTTPYTSIEDIPSAINTETIEDNLIIANKGLFDLGSDPESSQQQQHVSYRHPQLSPPDGKGVKRWNSLRGERPRADFKQASMRKEKDSGNKTECGSFLRNHSFKERHSIPGRPISMIGLVHSSRDNSDLVDRCDIVQRNRRLSEVEDNGVDLEPIVKDLMSLKKVKSVTPDPETAQSERSSQNDFVIIDENKEDDNAKSSSMIKKSSSVTSTGSNNSRKNRWSLKRSFHRNKRKHSKQDSTSDDESKQSSVSELSTIELMTPSDDITEFFSPTFSTTTDEDGDEEKMDFTQSLDIGHPNLLRPQSMSRVQALARDYSMRIKDKPPSASCSPVQEEILSPSPLPSNSISPSPGWLKNLKGRRQRSTTVSAGTRNGDPHYLSLSQPASPEPALDSCSGSPGEHTPTSATTTKTFNFGEKHEIEDGCTSQGMQKYASETLLSKSCEDIVEKPVQQTISKRKKPGWVKYLVKKFNTSK